MFSSIYICIAATSTSSRPAFSWLRVGCNTSPRFRVVPCRLLQRGFRRGAEDYYRQIATSGERCGTCCQRHPEVWSWPVTDYAYRASLAGRSWTNQLQTRYAHVPMPAQQSSSVPDGPLHISIRQGLRKPLFCVLKDELFTPEDELSWADGQK